MDEESEACVPLGDRKLRACLVTGLVKTEDQWINEGNQNVKCLDTTRDRELMFEVTSPNFDGCVSRDSTPFTRAAQRKTHPLSLSST